ncbi:MAG TPA: glycoside hydrolase family 5 protein, partial [Mycobacteriales bacterium]|nr:glycoside hydrolase family 5 protein [Mycobacteriales bacterium]
MQSKAAGKFSRRSFLVIGGATAGLAMAGPIRPTGATVPSFYTGANLSGLEVNSGVRPGVPNTDYAVPTAAELDYLHAHGLTTIRLPFLWERMQPTLGGALDPAYLALVSDLVDHAGSNGMKLVIDAHNFGGYAGHKIGDGTVTSAHFADLWTRLATTFAGRAGVAAYDLMNEPAEMPNTVAWPDAVQAAVNAVRAVDTGTLLFIEGDHYSSAASWQEVNGNLQITDPNNNYLYSAHVYFDRDSSGSHFDWATEVAAGDTLQSPPGPLTTNIGVQRITGFIDWLAAHGYSGQIGEAGTGSDDPHWLETLDNTLAYCRSHGVGLTYWAAGAWFRDYPMGIEEQLDGRDTVQMAVLEKYTGATAPKKYYLSGPQRGGAGAPSDPFTLDYRGYHTAPLTITPQDGGAGGTFSPASVSMPAGFNGLATFTYRAPGSATYRIGGTNSSGLTDPPPVGYSTRADAFSSIDPATILNVFATKRLYTPFIDSLVTLRRDSDGATESFGLAGDDLDTSAVTTWAAGSAVRVVTLADQGPARRDAGAVVTQNHDAPDGAQLPSSPADYPELVLNGLNGMPVLRFTTNRMDAVSPIAGLTGFTCFVVAKPASVASMNRLLSWHFTQYLLITADAGGTFSLSGEPALSMGIDPAAWHVYAVRWSGGGSLTSWVDGQPVATAASATSTIQFDYENH